MVMIRRIWRGRGGSMEDVQDNLVVEEGMMVK